MAEAVQAVSGIRFRSHPAWLAGAVFLLGLLTSLLVIDSQVPFSLWWPSLVSPDFDDIRQLLFRYSLLPRICMALIVGAALGLAGTVFQQVLRNPLAEPTTLGVSAGASVALLVATLWAPWLLAWGPEPVAFAGAGMATALVFLLARRESVSPLSLILAGLVVSLYCGAFASVVSFLEYDRLTSIFLWGTGMLNQNDWRGVTYLLPRVAAIAGMICLTGRQLELMALGDEGARSLGLSLIHIRLLTLGLAVALSALVVSAVGVVGFVGLAAPALARLAGARRLRDRLLWAPLMGAGLLWLPDELVQLLGRVVNEVPTGTATAFLGAPLLLWLLDELKTERSAPHEQSGTEAARAARPWNLVLILGLLLIGCGLVAIFVGQNGHGWHIGTLREIASLGQWRVPRVLAAMAAGVMLAAAGVLVQRLTGNPMASPEVLGISSGASLGVIISLVSGAAGQGLVGQVASASLGAFLVLAMMVALGHRVGFSPERMLLTGVAVGTIFSSIAALAMASGDPRMQMLMGWMSGSTYYVGYPDAFTAVATAVVFVPAAVLCHRWLTILPLGDAVSGMLGLDLVRSRLVLILLAAGLTAAATLIVGPLSFVGLMAPHMARMMGLQRSGQQLAGAVLIGAIILVAADFVGRNLLFPYQIPAGLLATFIGGPYLMWLMRR